MNLSGLHHIAIICSNYDKSRHFYVNILGLPILSETFREDRSSHKLDLQIPNGPRIELFSFPNPPPRLSYPEATGLRHLAFSVPNLVTAIDYLDAFQIPVEPIRTDAITKKRFTFFSDPDGLPIELCEE